VIIIIGGGLLLSGVMAGLSYLGLPLLSLSEHLLTPQLGQMAAIFLGLICGFLAVYHGFSAALNRPSQLLRLPLPRFFWLAFALVLGLGNVILLFEVAEVYLFPPLFLLGAALPTLGVLAWAGRRLGWPITWRQGSLGLVAGSTLSIAVTLILGGILSAVIYLLIGPLVFLGEAFEGFSFFGGSSILERIFFAPGIAIFLIITALEAPIPEEFAKVLGVLCFGRRRISNERQAFMLGLACGAGFAILENMLYEGIYAQYGGWSWGGVTLLRGLGAVLHPLGTGIVALGWFRMREGGFGKLLKAYLAAVGLHTLWNGGFLPFVYLTGLDYYAGLGPSLSIYGAAVEVMLVIFLAAVSSGLWWLLYWLVTKLAREVEPALASTRVSSRALAGWALATVLVITPIGAALGPAWEEIQAIVLAGG